MGAIGRLFGLALVLAGIFIAVYWTTWVLMVLVRIPPTNPPVALLQPEVHEPQQVFPGPSVDLPAAGHRPDRRHRLHLVFHNQHEQEDRGGKGETGQGVIAKDPVTV